MASGRRGRRRSRTTLSKFAAGSGGPTRHCEGFTSIYSGTARPRLGLKYQTPAFTASSPQTSPSLISGPGPLRSRRTRRTATSSYSPPLYGSTTPFTALSSPPRHLSSVNRCLMLGNNVRGHVEASAGAISTLFSVHILLYSLPNFHLFFNLTTSLLPLPSWCSRLTYL